MVDQVDTLNYVIFLSTGQYVAMNCYCKQWHKYISQSGVKKALFVKKSQDYASVRMKFKNQQNYAIALEVN